MTRRGLTLVETLVAAAIGVLVLFILYRMVHTVLSPESRHGLGALTARSSMQKDAKAGLRRAIYRLREAIQVLEPEPGQGGTELVVRDITNARVRLRRMPQEDRLVSERLVAGRWEVETRPDLRPMGSSQFSATIPVSMHGCTSLHFTVLSPECVVMEAGLESDGHVGACLTVIKLRNAGLAY